MPTTERVTVTLSAELVESIDRVEKDRARFIKDAVERELARRRREGLRRSLEHPHPEAAELADAGLEEWAACLPAGDEDLLDMSLGKPVRWVDGEGVGRGMPVTFDRGAVVLVVLHPAVGHEQRGQRPCIAVSDPAVNLDQRFPLIAVVPVTGTAGEGALYPRLSPDQSGLMKTSYALIDHVRSIDKRRIRRVFGQLADEDLMAIDQGLELFLGLGAARV